MSKKLIENIDMQIIDILKEDISSVTNSSSLTQSIKNLSNQYVHNCMNAFRLYRNLRLF